jgi:dipeptidyl aminopeptidase/acylaminoacyl peptidase
LGGGAWCFTSDGDHVVYTAVDGNLWRQALGGGGAEQVTEQGPERSAVSPTASPDGRHLAFVVDLAEVFCVDLTTGENRRIDDGTADFVIDPSWSPNGDELEWVAWNVPDMPWDRTWIERVSLDGTHLPAVTPMCALQQPRRMADGTRLSVRDDRGWLNLYADEVPLVVEPFEHAAPTWGPGQRSYAWSPDEAWIAFTRNERGFGRMCVVHRESGVVHEVARGVHGQLSWQGARLCALRTGARTPTQVVVYDTSTWDRTVVAVGPTATWPASDLIEPDLVEVRTAGTIVHARVYRAESPAGLIVWLHGGPTDQWQVTFLPRIMFWRSRGWHVLVPDHRGSTGHGREYQQALRGRWGELDVADSVAVVEWAQTHGLGSPGTTVVFGGSSGGFTALGVVAAAPHSVAAAVVLYPVTDLADLAERSHRFERHYTDTLVGPLPESLELVHERSPAFHADRFTATPLLILHGDVDPVVPVEQSRVFAARVGAAGGDVTLHVYEAEGHGFRQPTNQLDEYERVERFLDRHVQVASRL